MYSVQSAKGLPTSTPNYAPLNQSAAANARNGMGSRAFSMSYGGGSEEFLGGFEPNTATGGDYFDVQGHFIEHRGAGNGIFIQSPTDKSLSLTAAQFYSINYALKAKYGWQVVEQASINIATHYYINKFGSTANLVGGKITIYDGDNHGVYALVNPTRTTPNKISLSIGHELLNRVYNSDDISSLFDHEVVGHGMRVMQLKKTNPNIHFPNSNLQGESDAWWEEEFRATRVQVRQPAWKHTSKKFRDAMWRIYAQYRSNEFTPFFE